MSSPLARLGLVAIACVAAASCTPRTKEAPTVTGVTPASAPNDVAQVLTVTGEDFGRRVVADLDDPERSELQTTYTVELRLQPEGEPFALQGVTWVSEQALRAELAAGGAPGRYSVRVTDPWGNQAEAPDAFELFAPECSVDADCDDARACTTDLCEAQRCRSEINEGSCLIDGACIGEGVRPDNSCEACAPAASKIAWSPRPSSTSCDDALSCTVTDMCDGAGACVGQSTCNSPPGDCMEPAGTCTMSGCVYAPKPKKAACNDGLSCTEGGVCDGAGVCEPGASTCSATNPCDKPKGDCTPNGCVFDPKSAQVPCDDGLACTDGEVCDGAGACGPGASTCVSANACEEPNGACTTNGCVFTPKPATATCDDGLACTSGETCDGAGACAQGASDCVTMNQCEEPAGTCTAAGCVFTPKPLNTMCADSLGCTAGDVCDGAGVCVPGADSCPGLAKECELGACTASGCMFTPQPASTACTDDLTCTTGDTCNAMGVCVPAVSMCTSVMPTACLTVSPSIAGPGNTLTFDATCSSDPDGPASALEARFDFNGDGTFDTAFGPLTATHTIASGQSGVKLPGVEVRDATSAVDTAEAFYVVAPASTVVTVTTAADEQDAAATPSSPGGSGFSLREALTFVNGLTTSRVITFNGPMTINATGLLDLNNAGSSLVGVPGVVIDFSAVTALGSCFDISANGTSVFGVRIQSCSAQGVGVKAQNVQIAFCELRRGSKPGTAAKFEATGVRFGPGNDVRDYVENPAIEVKAAGAKIDGNHFENGLGVLDVKGAGNNTIFEANEVVTHTGDALAISNGVTGMVVRFNTFVANTRAIAVTGNTPLSVQNNIFVNGSGCALAGSAAAFAPSSPNLFFQNGGTGCAESPGAVGNVSADPLFINAAGGNLRLELGSPAVNAGVPLGVDMNGAATGHFFGTAPDLGAHETPY